MPPQQPLPLLPLPPQGHYRLPTVYREEGAVVVSDGGPVRIHLRLETGLLLDLPLTQATIDALYLALKSLTTKP